VLADADMLMGRHLARAVAAGEPLRAADLRPRQWFAAGDSVKIVAVGAGFSVSGDGQALSAGIEGQLVRVRTDNGRIVSGMPQGARRVEVAL
jgi:flagella basal body P-ring formation protein FlgA